MKVEIISIGDELLIGQTVNTNASWMGKKLADLGASIEYCTVIRDQRSAILEAFRIAMDRVDVVLVTGGLGPTNDDITKDVICEFFDVQLVQNDSVLQHVRSFFNSRNRPMLDVNIRQALVPETSKVLHNAMGTAPGMLMEREGKMLVSMPGVPYEMKYIVETHLLTLMKERFQLNSLYFRTIQTQGIGESYIAQRIESLEDEMRSKGIALAYLPSPGSVRLRLSSVVSEENNKLIADFVKRIYELLPQYVFGEDDDSLSMVIGKLLTERAQTLSTVESCTGGALAASIVSVSGSSAYYEGSIVSYSNEVKSNIVNVQKTTIDQYGVVSKEVVVEMASNGRKILNTDYCLALSGIAGPDGGSEDKPVGTVWIGVAGPERVLTKKFQFENNRQRNIQRSILTAFNLLRCELL